MLAISLFVVPTFKSALNAAACRGRLLQELAEDSIFQGPPHSCIFLHNVQALTSRKYLYAGMLVAVSLANGGSELPCFAEVVYACYGLHYKYTPDLSLIPDISIQDNLEQVRFSTQIQAHN